MLALTPDDGKICNICGLTRCLTGDIQGVIEDFEFFVKWAEETSQGKNIDWRRGRIGALKVDKNPFNTATLEKLRND